MIIRLEYQDNGLVGIKTIYRKKEKRQYIRYVVDEFSIEKALKEAETNKYIIALDYEGDLQYLYNIKEIPKIPIIYRKKLKEINELSISFLLSSIPDWVIVSIMTNPEFCDMRLVEKLSQQYPNIRFCGGKFLRLPGCNVGCIQRKDIPDKVTESKVKYYTDGCACILTTMELKDVEGAEMLYADKEHEKEIQGEENKKRIINNIEDLLNL